MSWRPPDKDFSEATESGWRPPDSDFESEKSIGGFARNAVQDVEDLASTGYKAGKGTFKAIFTEPMKAAKAGVQIARGRPIMEAAEPLIEDAKTVGTIVKNAPGAVFQQYADIAKHPIEESYRHPVNTAVALLPLAKPAATGLRMIPAVDSSINSVASKVLQPAAQSFGRRALGFSKRFLNKTETQLPEANQAAQTALDTGIIRNPIFHPLSSGPEAMFERANKLEGQVGSKIGEYLKGQNQAFDWNQALDDLEQLKLKFPADKAVVNQIDNIKDTIISTVERNGGDLSFEQANQLKSYIQSKIPWSTDKASAEVGQRAAGTFRGSIDQQLEKASKTGTAEFKRNKKLYGDIQTIQKGLLNKRAAESGNMAVSLPSIGVGVVEMAHGGWIKGVLTALGAEWVKKHGSAIAATMSDKAAKILSSNPAKYQSIVETAAKGGAASVAAVEAALQKEPEFSQIIQKPSKPAKPLFGEKAAGLPKRLDEKTAMAYLKKANDDVERARELALADGYEIA